MLLIYWMETKIYFKKYWKWEFIFCFGILIMVILSSKQNLKEHLILRKIIILIMIKYNISILQLFDLFFLFSISLKNKH